MGRRLLAVAAGLTVSLGLGNAQSAPNDNDANPGVIPPRANAFGDSYGEWSAQWWQWAASLPPDMHPLTDTADCSTGQSGNVWFLGGRFGSIDSEADDPGEVERMCTVPSGTALFFPILNVLCTEEEDLRACATDIMDHAVDLLATITHDGVELEIQDLDAYRAESPLFTIEPNVEQGNVLGLAGDTAAVSDGFYLMLAPLSVGTHTIHFEGSIVFTEAEDGFDLRFDLSVTYSITVVPRGLYQTQE